MPSGSRRRILRQLGVVAAGPAITSAVIGGVGDTPTAGASTSTAFRTDSELVEWHNTYGDGNYQCKEVLDTPDGVLLVGRTDRDRSASAWLGAVGPDGEPRWTTTFETPGFTIPADAVSHKEGYTVLVTTDVAPAMRLVSLDSDGQVVNHHRLDGPEEMTDKNARIDSASNDVTSNAHVLQSTPQGYLIGGYLGTDGSRTTNTEYDAWVRAIDVDGGTRWDRRYDGAGVASIEPLGDDYLLVGSAAGDAWLQAIDPGGAPRWQHTYGGVNDEIATVAVPTDRGILYGGRTGSVPDRHSAAMLVWTTAVGEFVWRRTRKPQSVAALRPFDGGFVMTGEPQSKDAGGRNPEKPVSLIDRWGRIRKTATVSVDPGAPVGLATLTDGGVVVGGWDRRGGVWLAKIDF